MSTEQSAAPASIQAKDWPDYYCRLASLLTEMQGAADYFDAEPDYATDARLAETFRDYIARSRQIERPSR